MFFLNARVHPVNVVQVVHPVLPALQAAAGEVALALRVHQEVVAALHPELALMGPAVKTLEERIQILNLHLICDLQRVEQTQVVR